LSASYFDDHIPDLVKIIVYGETGTTVLIDKSSPYFHIQDIGELTVVEMLIVELLLCH